MGFIMLKYRMKGVLTVRDIEAGNTRFLKRNHFIRNLHVECRNICRTYTTKGKFSKGLFNLKNFYNAKQSRIRKLVPFICSQNPHRLLAMLVLSSSFFIDPMLQSKFKAKFRILMFCTCLYHYYSTTCEVKIKKLLRNF